MTRLVVSGLRIQAQPLDKGHFAPVYEGEHMIHGPVAVKVMERLPTESQANWDVRKSDLLQEGQRLKDAEHERVVRVYDLFHDAEYDKIYLVMELCSQGSLKQRYEIGPMGLREVRDFVSDVALGLDCIHSRNLLHRDIKPANILVGQDGRAKLGDFGLVTDRLVLGYGSVQGYSDHIAYEVWRDRRTSIRSDIWALGMTVYRLLHGKSFYEELDPPRNLVSSGGYAERLAWLPHIPKGWRSFVKKCMNDDPSRRYQNAQQVLTALSALPISPAWACSFSPSRVVWERRRGDRLISVTHSIHSPRRHEWAAMSSPVSGAGRSRRLDGSNGVVSKGAAEAGLVQFFREVK